MSKPRWSKKVTRQVTAVATGKVTTLTTDWMLVYGAGSGGVRLLEEARQLTGNYSQLWGIRTAEVSPDFPDAWSDSIGTPRTTAGASIEDLTPTTGKLWVQGHITASSSSGVAEALASVQICVNSTSELVASGSVLVQPNLNVSQAAYYPIGAPFPALGLTGLMAGVQVKGVNGTLSWLLAIRYFNRPDIPGDYSDVTSSHNSTSDEFYNANGSVTPPSSPSYMWAQAALKVTSAARGELAAVIAAKY